MNSFWDFSGIHPKIQQKLMYSNSSSNLSRNSPRNPSKSSCGNPERISHDFFFQEIPEFCPGIPWVIFHFQIIQEMPLFPKIISGFLAIFLVSAVIFFWNSQEVLEYSWGILSWILPRIYPVYFLIFFQEFVQEFLEQFENICRDFFWESQKFFQWILQLLFFFFFLF